MVALAAGLIARRQHGVSPDNAYVYALFHDAAIPALMRRFPDYAKVRAEAERRRRPVVEVEAEVLSCTHPIVGALMVRNWGLPSVMSQAVRFHHEADVYSLPQGSLQAGGLDLIAVTHVAEHLVLDMTNEPDIEVGPFFEHACRHLGIDDSDLQEYRDDIEAAAGAH